jgi:hypothetical protein
LGSENESLVRIIEYPEGYNRVGGRD